MDQNSSDTNQTSPSKCMTCKGDTQGFKCAECGEKSDQKDPDHSCGDKYQTNCAGCDQGENNCMCPPQTTTA